MRYIRTKDGIYDTSTMSISSLYDSGNFVKNVSYCKRIDDFTLLNIYENDIIKQADTIEELCDSIVVALKNGNIYTCPVNDNNLELAKAIYPNFKLAIWADKGLIYVAKMNSKGELELL